MPVQLKKPTSSIAPETDEIEFKNPVMTGLAATNRPHLMGLEPVSWIEQDGKRLLKIPFLILGKWRHKLGILDFTTKFVSRLEQGLKENRAGHEIAWDLKHKPELGAFAWLKKKLLTEIRPDNKTQISALADPTTAGAQIVDEQRYRYASVEFHPNFADRLISAATLSADDILSEEVDGDSHEEDNMPGNQNDTTPVVSLEDFESLQSLVTKLQADQDTLVLEKDALRVTVEAQADVALAQRKIIQRQLVDGIVASAEARRDEEDRALPGVFLEWLEDVLKLEPLEHDGETIALEEGVGDVGAVHAYYRKAIALLATTLPGWVPMGEAGTDPDKERPITQGSNDDQEVSEEDDTEIENAWALA